MNNNLSLVKEEGSNEYLNTSNDENQNRANEKENWILQSPPNKPKN